MLKLFYATGACSLAPHIALEEVGATYEAVRVNMKDGEQRKPEYLKINPKGRVPALLTDRGVLTENPAILAYIAQSFPDANLAPTGDAFAFAEMQAFNIFLTSSVHLTFTHAFRPERFGEGEAAAAAMRAKVPISLTEYFALIEERLSDGRSWVHGETFSISDPYLFVFSSWLQRGSFVDPERIPQVLAHRARVAARPAVRQVLAREGA